MHYNEKLKFTSSENQCNNELNPEREKTSIPKKSCFTLWVELSLQYMQSACAHFAPDWSFQGSWQQKASLSFNGGAESHEHTLEHVFWNDLRLNGDGGGETEFKSSEDVLFKILQINYSGASRLKWLLIFRWFWLRSLQKM